MGRRQLAVALFSVISGSEAFAHPQHPTGADPTGPDGETPPAVPGIEPKKPAADSFRRGLAIGRGPSLD